MSVIEVLPTEYQDARLYSGVRVWRGEAPLAKLKIHGPIARKRAGAWFSAGPSGVVLSTPLFGASAEACGSEEPSIVRAHLSTGWDFLVVYVLGKEHRFDLDKAADRLIGPRRNIVSPCPLVEGLEFEVDNGDGPVSYLCNVQITRVAHFRGPWLMEIKTFASVDLRPYGRAPAHGGKRGDGDCCWLLSVALERPSRPEEPISSEELAWLAKLAVNTYHRRYCEDLSQHGPWEKPTVDTLESPTEEEKVALAISQIPPMLTWDGYTNEALKTWKPESFPALGSALTYALLGLKSELGEVAGVEKRALRDGVSPEETTESLILELGDVCWYLAISRHEAEKQGISTGQDLYSFMIHHDFTNEDAAYLAWQVFPAAGALPAVMRPTIQGGQWFDVKTLFRRNIEKLRSRQIRGKIKGKGDKR